MEMMQSGEDIITLHDCMGQVNVVVLLLHLTWHLRMHTVRKFFFWMVGQMQMYLYTIILTSFFPYIISGDLEFAAIGQYNVQDGGGQGVAFRTITQEVLHPDYGLDDAVSIDRYDLMFVKFDRPTGKTRISLNFDANVPAQSGVDLLMLGFGFITATGPVSQTLQVAPTMYVDPDDCVPLLCTGNCANYPYPEDIFCTKQNEPEIYRQCFGDSGGPVILPGATADDDVLVSVIQG